MTEHDSERQPSVSRRDLIAAMAAGAAATGALPSPAKPEILQVASAADYVRDPTRWGSPEVARCFRASSISTCAPVAR
jgi:hypothetical protein